jgi:hypothetical protein
MDNETYHAHPAIGASDIKQFLRSPYHYWASKHGPQRERKPPTPSMQLGTALHTSVLEPDRFDREYGIKLNIARRSNKEKELHSEHEASFKYLLTSQEYEQVLFMTTALRIHPEAGELLRGIEQAESSFFSECPRTGLQLKCRPDALHPASHSIIDIKTTVDASDRRLRYTFADFGYDVQAVHYLYCLLDYRDFRFLIVESNPPYSVRVVTLGDACMGNARLKHFKALEGIGHLTETLGVGTPWPAYESKMLTL